MRMEKGGEEQAQDGGSGDQHLPTGQRKGGETARETEGAESKSRAKWEERDV